MLHYELVKLGDILLWENTDYSLLVVRCTLVWLCWLLDSITL